MLGGIKKVVLLYTLLANQDVLLAFDFKDHLEESRRTCRPILARMAETLKLKREAQEELTGQRVRRVRNQQYESIYLERQDEKRLWKALQEEEIFIVRRILSLLKNPRFESGQEPEGLPPNLQTRKARRDFIQTHKHFLKTDPAIGESNNTYGQYQVALIHALMGRTVSHLRRRGQGTEAMINAATENVMKALNFADSSLNSDLFAYVSTWLRPAQFQYLADPMVQIGIMGREKSKRFYALQKFIEGFTARFGRHPSSDEIIEGLRYNKQTVEAFLLLLSKGYFSIESSAAPKGSSDRRSLQIEATTEPGEPALEYREILTALKRAIRNLSPKDQDILIARFFNLDRPLTYREIGEQLGVSSQTILNREERILKELRTSHYLEAALGYEVHFSVFTWLSELELREPSPAMRRVRSQLTEDERRFLDMVYREDVPMTEIAEASNYSRSHLSYLRKRLLHKIETLLEEDNERLVREHKVSNSSKISR